MGRFAIQSTTQAQPLYWHGNAWSANLPPENWSCRASPDDVAIAQTELERLQAALPHDTTLRIVDAPVLVARAKAWSQAFRQACEATGYAAISMEQRQQPEVRQLRMSAIQAANRAVDEMGLDFTVDGTRGSSAAPRERCSS